MQVTRTNLENPSAPPPGDGGARGGYVTDGHGLFRVLSHDSQWIELEDQQDYTVSWVRASTAQVILRDVAPASTI